MPKIDKKISITISIIITFALFVGFLAMAVFLPALVERYVQMTYKPAGEFWPILVIFYIGLIPAFIADVSLYLLLNNAKTEKIFTEPSVKYLRTISWCCMAETVVFFALSFYCYTASLLCFAAFFMGVILRVVKNVIEAAVEIKAENDYTI